CTLDEDLVQRVESQALHGHHLIVSYGARLAQRIPLGGELRRRESFAQPRCMEQLGDARDIDVNRIAKEATGGTGRTHVVAAIQQCVKRIYADEISTD